MNHTKYLVERLSVSAPAVRTVIRLQTLDTDKSDQCPWLAACQLSARQENVPQILTKHRTKTSKANSWSDLPQAGRGLSLSTTALNMEVLCELSLHSWFLHILKEELKCLNYPANKTLWPSTWPTTGMLLVNLSFKVRTVFPLVFDPRGKNFTSLQ